VLVFLIHHPDFLCVVLHVECSHARLSFQVLAIYQHHRMSISLRHTKLWRASDLAKLPMMITDADRDEWRLRAASKEEAKGHYLEKWKMADVLFLRWVHPHPVHHEPSNQHRFKGQFILVEEVSELDKLVVKSKKRKKQMTKLENDRIARLHDKHIHEKVKKEHRKILLGSIDAENFFPEQFLIDKWRIEKERAQKELAAMSSDEED
jgi:hypothetical protein